MVSLNRDIFLRLEIKLYLMIKNIGVIGSGGREHVLSETLKESEYVDNVFCLPGNGGTALSDGITNLDYESFDDLYKKLKDNSVDFVVVGPEGPLADGISDFLTEKSIDTFGFDQKTAKLESSKVYAGRFKEDYGVSSPDFEVFEDYGEALSYLEKEFLEEGDKSFWIKADELCGGKGALKAGDFGEGQEAIDTLLREKKCGVGEKVVVQENLEGDEATILTFTDGETYIQMPAMQDHKSIKEGGKGPNTGGYGGLCPSTIDR